MHADRLSRWLTLGANIGVVVGLAVLIFEVKQNQELTRAQIHQDRTDAWVSNTFARADSEFLAPMMVKLFDAGFPANMSAMEGLTPLERRRFNTVMVAFKGDYANMFYQYQQGYLDEEFYENGIVGSIRTLAPWWRKTGQTEQPSFKKEVDRILSSD